MPKWAAGYLRYTVVDDMLRMTIHNHRLRLLSPASTISGESLECDLLCRSLFKCKVRIGNISRATRKRSRSIVPLLSGYYRDSMD